MDNWLHDWWSVECRQQVSIVEYVDNTKRRSLFIAADGYDETQRIRYLHTSRVVL